MLVGTALAWRDIPAPALAKFAVTGSVACALCYLAAGLLLRTSPASPEVCLIEAVHDPARREVRGAAAATAGHRSPACG